MHTFISNKNKCIHEDDAAANENNDDGGKWCGHNLAKYNYDDNGYYYSLHLLKLLFIVVVAL